MRLRSFVAGVAAVVAFLGTGFVIIIIANYLVAPDHFSWSDHPIQRMGSLFLCFLVASTVYYLIKGDESDTEVKIMGDKNNE